MALGGQSAPSTSVDSGPSGVNSYYHGAELQMMYPPLPPDYVTHGYAQGVNGNVPNHQTDPYAARGLDTYQPAQDIIDPCLLDMIPDPLPEANGDISDRRPLTPDEFDALTASISGQWTVQGDIFY
jgi:hypothetical protein